MPRKENSPRSLEHHKQTRRAKVVKVAKGVAAIGLVAATATPFTVLALTDGHAKKLSRARVKAVTHNVQKAADTEARDLLYLRYAEQVAKKGYLRVRASESLGEGGLFAPMVVNGVRIGTSTPNDFPVFRYTSDKTLKGIYTHGRRLTPRESIIHADLHHMTPTEARSQTVATRTSMTSAGVSYAANSTELERVYQLGDDITQSARDSLTSLRKDVQRDEVENEEAINLADGTGGITYTGELADVHNFRPGDPAYGAVHAEYLLAMIKQSNTPPPDLPDPRGPLQQ